MRLWFVVVALLCISITGASAQSAAETALFIATGVEIGTITRNRAGDPLFSYEKLSDDPLILYGTRLHQSPGFSNSTATVKEFAPCKFMITTNWSQSYQNEKHDYLGETSIDLSDPKGEATVRPFPEPYMTRPPYIIDFPSGKMEGRVFKDGKLITTSSIFPFYSTQEELTKKLQHMRDRYCPRST